MAAPIDCPTCPADESVPERNDAVFPSAEPVSRRERWLAGGLSLSGFLIFYVVSAGPVSGLAHAMKIQALTNVLQVIYAPLVFIVKHDLQPFSTILKAWAGLFR